MFKWLAEEIWNMFSQWVGENFIVLHQLHMSAADPSKGHESWLQSEITGKQRHNTKPQRRTGGL